MVTVEGLAGPGRAGPGAGGVRRGRRRPMWILHARTDRGRGRPDPAQPAAPRRRDAGGAGREPVPLHRATRRSSTRYAWPRPGDAHDRAWSSTAPRSPRWTRQDRVRRRTPGRRGRSDHGGRTRAGAALWTVRRVVDGRGCLLTPGLVNTHHHLYQWATRGYARRLHPVRVADRALPGLGPDQRRRRGRRRRRRAGLAGPVRAAPRRTDHHYVFPRGGGDMLGRHGGRGGPDRPAVPPDPRLDGPRPVAGRPAAGLGGGDASTTSWPPARTRSSGSTTRRPGAMVRVGAGPVLAVLGQRRPAHASRPKLARSLGVRLHTHLAETLDEEEYCQQRHGCTPVEYLDRLGWLGDDVWLAHARAPGPGRDRPARRDRHRRGALPVVQRPARRGHRAEPGPARRRRAGRARRRRRGLAGGRAARGRAAAGRLRRPACADSRPARRRSTARQALAMATIGGARCLGRADEIGSLESGKLADLALWRLDGLGHAGIADPVAALVFGSAAAAGTARRSAARIVVERDELRHRRRGDCRRRPAPRLRGGAAMTVDRGTHDRHSGPGGVGESPTRPDGTLKVQRRVRLLLRPVARRGAVRGHPALAAPAGPDHRHRHLGGAGRARRATRC